jgi:hypothetical protein
MMVLQMQRVRCLLSEVLLAVEDAVDDAVDAAVDTLLERSAVILVPLACCKVQ